MLKSGGYLLFYAVFGLFFLFAVETSAQDTGARWWNMAVTPSPSSEFEVKNTYFAFFNITVDGASGFKLDKGIGINTSTFSKMIKQDLANILYEKKVFYPCRGSCLQMAQSAKAPPLSIRVISRELQWGFWAGKVTYDMTVEFLINGSVVESFEERLVSPGLLTFRNDLRSVIAKRLTNSASLSSSLPSLEKINLEHLQYGEWDKINTSQLTGFTGAMYVPQDDGLGIAAITLGGPMHLLGYSVGDVLTYVEGIGSLIGITNSEFNLKIAKELPQNTLITTVFERGGEVHLGELYFGMDAKLPQQLGYPANWFDEGKRMNVQVVEALQTRSLCQVMPTGTSQAPLNWFILEGDDCMGLKTGEVRMISVDGSREYKGELVDGRMRLGSYTWRNTGRRYEGGFYNSRPYGRGTIVEGSKITFSDNMKDTFMAFNMARGGKLSSFTEGGKRYNLSDGNNDAMQALMTRYLGGEDVSFETQDLANAVMQNQQEQEFLKAERKRQEAAERKQLAAERRRKSQQEDNMLGAIFGGLAAGVVGSNAGMDASTAMEFGTSMATDIYSGGTANTTAMKNRMQGQHQAKMTRLTNSNNANRPKANLIKNPAGFDKNGDYRDSNGNLAPNPNSSTARNTSQSSAPDPMGLARQALGDDADQLNNYGSQALGTGQQLALKTGTFSYSCGGESYPVTVKYYTQACFAAAKREMPITSCGPGAGSGSVREASKARCMSACGSSYCTEEVKR